MGEYGDDRILLEARTFLEERWEDILGDLETLVAIDSSTDAASAGTGAPFGAGPRAALDAMLDLAASYGFATHDCEGYCGYAELPGASRRQLGVIAHLDVVPAGEGWNFDPFALTRKDGFLLGRGVIDDKGPLVVAFHALRFWRDKLARDGAAAPVNVRMLFGCSEETGMSDADYYIEHYGAPDFLFTPDADFPLCYGEKGQLQVRVHGPAAGAGAVVEMNGGSAMNGVPASASARVRHAGPVPPATPRVRARRCGDGELLVEASGVAGHAAMPHGSLNAVGLLVAYLLDNGLADASERLWFEFVCDAARASDGSGLGVACSDDDFGELTCVASVASCEEGRFTQALDIRFPTTTNVPGLLAALEEKLVPLSATIESVNAVEPLVVSPDSREIAALRSAYEQVSGREARLFTMGGGTYAHHFPVAVSFGPNDEERFPPESWVGGMHAADEGVAEEALRQALLVYIVAFGKLFDLDWS